MASVLSRPHSVYYIDQCKSRLTHWVTHICVSKLAIIGADNGLSPSWRQAIIWTNSGIFFIGPLETNCSEILIKICISSWNKMHLKMPSGNWRPFFLGLNVLKICPTMYYSLHIRDKPTFLIFFKVCMITKMVRATLNFELDHIRLASGAKLFSMDGWNTGWCHHKFLISKCCTYYDKQS